MKEDNTLVEQIKDLVSQELAKRCIFAKIKKCEIVKDRFNKDRIELETEDFQTTPCIFKRIYIHILSSDICQNTEYEGVIGIYLTLDCKYELFDGGSNGCTLMNLDLKYFEKTDRLHLTKVF